MTNLENWTCLFTIHRLNLACLFRPLRVERDVAFYLLHNPETGEHDSYPWQDWLLNFRVADI